MLISSISRNLVELEIQRLLLAGDPPDAVADALTKKFIWTEMNSAELESFSNFFLKCGFFATLVNTIIKHLSSGPIPWPFFAEALCRAHSAIEPEIKIALIQAAEEKNELENLARSHQLDHFDERLGGLRKKRAQNLKTLAQKKRDDLLSELELFKSQGLLEKETEILAELLRFFPGDSEVMKYAVTLKERGALNSLNRNIEGIRRHQRPTPPEKSDPEAAGVLQNIENSMEDIVQQNPQMAFDFSIAHLMWENFQASQSFLNRAPDNVARGWLRVHLLLASRRFVDVLEELPALELLDANNPESTLQGAYFRAQALWGLNQKFSAIELLESLLANCPDYRAGSSLLAVWKDDLE